MAPQAVPDRRKGRLILSTRFLRLGKGVVEGVGGKKETKRGREKDRVKWDLQHRVPLIEIYPRTNWQWNKRSQCTADEKQGNNYKTMVPLSSMDRCAQRIQQALFVSILLKYIWWNYCDSYQFGIRRWGKGAELALEFNLFSEGGISALSCSRSSVAMTDDPFLIFSYLIWILLPLSLLVLASSPLPS